MIRYFTLLTAAYGLLAIETTLGFESGVATPHGSFVWMLLPWLATTPSKNAAIATAAFYGLMVDSFSSHHPGILMAATILATCVLQRVIAANALETSVRVFVVSFMIGCLMAMLLATTSLLSGATSGSPAELAGSIATSSAFAALLVTIVVATVRSILRVATPLRSPGL